MAQYNSVQFAQIITTPPTFNLPTEVSGKVRSLYAKYTTDASVGVTTSDAVVIGKLPKGARVISAEAFVPASFLTSSSKLGYGTLAADGTYTAVDDDRWGSGIDLSSIGRKQFLTVPADLAYLVLNATDNPTLQTIDEVAIAWTPVTTTTGLGLVIEFLIQYVVE